VYEYQYLQQYGFYNQTAGKNQTKSVLCLCQEYTDCGCDDNGNSTFLESLVGDGNPATLNQTIVRVANINGTDTIVLNGTLPNGTARVTSGALGGGMDCSWIFGWLAIQAVTFVVL
jgi:hypothetical protein